MDLSMYLDDFEYVCLVVAWFALQKNRVTSFYTTLHVA